MFFETFQAGKPDDSFVFPTSVLERALNPVQVEHQCRNRFYFHRIREIAIRVDVDLYYHDVGVLACQILQDFMLFFTWSAPRRREINDHDLMFRDDAVQFNGIAGHYHDDERSVVI